MHTLSRKTLVEQVTEAIEREIENETWPVGSKIPSEPELVERFDVSRNTVREAIKALVHTGVLQSKQGSGTIVCARNSFSAVIQKELATQQLRHTLEVRFALEREAARLASLHHTNEQLLHMKRAMKHARTALEGHDIEAFLKADFAFHEAVIHASHNDLLIDLYGQLSERIEQSIRELVSTDQEFAIHRHIHTELFEAIQQRDVAQALIEAERYITQFQHVYETAKGELS